MNSRLRWTVWICAAIMLATSLTGCTGCNQDPLVKRKKELDDIDKKKEKKKQKSDFELRPVKTVPTDEVAVRQLAKPGHWLSTLHEIKANNFNFAAQLHTRATDERGKPYPVEATSYVLEGSRPAKLAKGQGRYFEATYFVPRIGALPSETIWLDAELHAARGGRIVTQPLRDPITSMPGYQYYFVVLSNAPSRYGFLQRLTAINTPTSREVNDESLLFYRVLQPEIGRFVPLPKNALTWTSIGYLLLDDLDAARVSPLQQRALLDWLHWGGQVIISGPNSLAKLQGSFLQDYLPAQAGDTVEIDAAAIAELNTHWSLPPHPTRDTTRTLEVLPQTPMMGVALLPHQDAVPLAHTADLVWERRIGQGRVVVSAFSLTDRYMMQWGASYDSFFNACLLRKPRREFRVNKSDGIDLINTVWKDLPLISTKDARLATTQRYFTRDVGHFAESRRSVKEPGEEKSLLALDEANSATGRSLVAATRSVDPAYAIPIPPGEDWHNDGYPPRLNYGMGAWNDRSGASDAARQALEDAAGISIPQGNFVLRVLALYLLILAPVNWAFFRMIGRVEWAWVAAPLIAIVGAFIVVRTAQLDIGFARSVTEVVVAEVHGGYPRAHVTRYSAMYTSLSTGYDFVFEDDAAVAQPLGDIDFRPDLSEATHTVTMHREGDLRFGGIQVTSNSIGYMHCEQHADLGGVFSLSGNDVQGFQITNGSRLSLRGAGVLRGGPNGRVSGAWIGDLGAGTASPVEFQEMPDGRPQLAQWDDALATLSYKKQAVALLERLDSDADATIDREEASRDPEVLALFDRIDGASEVPRNGLWEGDEITQWCRQTRAGEVSVGQLVELASHQLALPDGEVRLIAWSDDEIPGMTIRPGAAQVMRRTLFLIHLQHGAMTTAAPDVNCKADFDKQQERRLDESDLEEFDGEAVTEEAGKQGSEEEETSDSTRDNTKAKETPDSTPRGATSEATSKDDQPMG